MSGINYAIWEYFTNGYNINILTIISIISILSAILVIIAKNPIVSLLWLIGLFASISLYLIILGLNFIGLSYLIVYIGAVSILFLFILMLINIRVSELENYTRNSIPLGIIIMVLFNYSFFEVLPFIKAQTLTKEEAYEIINNLTYGASSLFGGASSSGGISSESASSSISSSFFHTGIVQDFFLSFFNIIKDFLAFVNYNDLYYVTGVMWEGYLAEMDHITNIGNIMYTNYSIWLIMASLILLLAMTGSIVITLKLK